MNKSIVSVTESFLSVKVSWKAPEAGFPSDSTVRLDAVKPPPHRLSLTSDHLTGKFL